MHFGASKHGHNIRARAPFTDAGDDAFYACDCLGFALRHWLARLPGVDTSAVRLAATETPRDEEAFGIVLGMMHVTHEGDVICAAALAVSAFSSHALNPGTTAVYTHVLYARTVYMYCTHVLLAWHGRMCLFWQGSSWPLAPINPLDKEAETNKHLQLSNPEPARSSGRLAAAVSAPCPRGITGALCRRQRRPKRHRKRSRSGKRLRRRKSRKNGRSWRRPYQNFSHSSGNALSVHRLRHQNYQQQYLRYQQQLMYGRRP